MGVALVQCKLDGRELATAPAWRVTGEVGCRYEYERAASKYQGGGIREWFKRTVHEIGTSVRGLTRTETGAPGGTPWARCLCGLAVGHVCWGLGGLRPAEAHIIARTSHAVI
jgi:hypothetical protein